jgi:mannose-6-phosphate isomerase-like protein (cupin superfamily)
LARRAYTQCADAPATVHLTNISAEAKTHYHKRLTETYVILSCGPDAAIELDGQKIPVRPLTSVMIPPGVRHRALGEMQVVIFCTPKFDPADEHFD